MNNTWNSYVEKYDAWFDKNKFAYLSELEVLKKLVPLNGKGLEIGVGTGRFAKPLNISVGIDPLWGMLEAAVKRKVKAFYGRGEEIPFEEEEFDYALMVTTLCFVKNPDKVIKEARRVIKSNGEIIIGIIDRSSFMGKHYMNKSKSVFYKNARFYSAEEVIELLKNNNFVNIKTYQTLFQLPGKIKKIDKIEKGYGKGGFVVISGNKCK